MYNNLKFVLGRKLIPNSHHINLLVKCSNMCFNNYILKCKILNDSSIKWFSTFALKNPTLKDNFAQSYMIKREDVDHSEHKDESNKSLVNKLDDLSRSLQIQLNSVPFELEYVDIDSNFVVNYNVYPQQSPIEEGHINLSLTNSDLFMKHYIETKLHGFEKNILHRKIKPSTMLLTDRYVSKNHKNNIKSSNTGSEQHLINDLFEKNISETMKSINPSDAVSLIKSVYLLKIPVGYERMCNLVSSALKGLSTLSIRELVELAICTRSYLDNENSYIRWFLLAIGSILEDRSSQIKLLSQQSLIDYLLPLALMQVGERPISWSILLNHEILDKITERFHSLDQKYMAKLLTILSSLEQCPDASNKYYRVYESLVNCLKASLNTLEANEIINMLNMPILFPNLELFRESLFKQVLERRDEFSVNSLAMLYLKYREEIPKEQSNEILDILNKSLSHISPKYLPDLYCCYLKRGELKAKLNSNYEHYLIMNYKTLSIKNISNLLMYLSINGRSKCSLYSWIIKRFQMLRMDNKVNNQELLDVVLSMSLVGIQNINVWNRMNIGNLIYQTPKNLLVYLGYSFLITNYGDKNSWKVLLERILLENKHFNPETYEVIKAAQILEYIPSDNNNNPRLYFMLNQCRGLYLTKLAKQRYTSSVPYEKIFERLDIQYKKRAIPSDLYEAYYLLPELKIIIDITRDPINHPTSGSVVGEAVLRHHVWNKLKYRTFTFQDSFWDKFKKEEEDDKIWNIEGMIEMFCNYTKLYHLKNKRRAGRLPILKAKEPDKGNMVLRSIRNPTKLTNTSEPSSRIKRLQSILSQKSTE